MNSAVRYVAIVMGASDILRICFLLSSLLFSIHSLSIHIHDQRQKANDSHSHNQHGNVKPSTQFTEEQVEDLMLYARATWKSMVSLTFPTGLTSDKMDDDNDNPVPHTSVTNIAAYMWSIIVARDLDIISNTEAVERLNTTLQTLSNLKKYDGHFLNWYNAKTGEGSQKFVSSVDSGWMASGLVLVKNAVPEVRAQASILLDTMDFGIFWDEPTGCISSGFYPLQNKTSGHAYCYLNSETRIAVYVGIGRNQLEEKLYFNLARTPPGDCSALWTEMKPDGYTKTYMGVEVFEGHYRYQGYKLVPSWGGSMFEALMVPLIVPEETWGPKSWGINHPLYVKAQIKHGMDEAKYGYWGFSPAYDPSGGKYMQYGVDAIGIQAHGYYSNNYKTGVDYGYGDCGRDPKPDPPASEYTNGVVTPHAVFLGLKFEPQATMDSLRKLRDSFPIYGKYGFYDAVNVWTGEVARKQLSLDQGMIMAAIGNALADDCLRRYFAAEPGMTEKLQPLLSLEEFSSGVGK